MTELEVELPAIGKIVEPALRELVLRAWTEALVASTWPSATSCPFHASYSASTHSLARHSNNVAELAYVMAHQVVENLRRDTIIDVDTVVAGALLHDVSKVIEYEEIEGEVVKTALGRNLPHASAGVAMLSRLGASPALLHVVGAHTAFIGIKLESIEASIVNHADMVDADAVAVGSGRPLLTKHRVIMDR